MANYIKILDVERKRKYDLREIVNGTLYLVKTGCQWRMLPGDFPKWQIVYYAQSVNSTLVSSLDKWFDAGKKIKGIKRHLIVDTPGLILAVVIQSASVQDRDGAVSVIDKLMENRRRVIKIFADGRYAGKLIGKVKDMFKIEPEIIKRDELHTFKILPKRWIVERTFSWIDTNRRNSKNYERLNNTSVAMVYISAIRIMMNRF